MKLQSDESKKGEIEFRKHLARQQIEGKCVFQDEFDADAIESLLRKRMEKTFEQMASLKERGIALSPYIEIGAERCQRSLVMENDLNTAGAAIDISYNILKSCDYYKEIFNKSKTPVRVCCDANNLPFMADSIPFVFCYETLHHFPDPIPIVKEIHRVLSPGGHFFFDEEPFKKVFHIGLYKGNKSFSKNSLQASKIRKIVDYFFSENQCNEIEYGIVENYEISLRTWKQAFHDFEGKDIKLQSLKNINSGLFNPESYVRFLFSYLCGGTITGTCHKAGVGSNREVSIHDVLMCPSCSKNELVSKVSQENLSFTCDRCGTTFPVVDGVAFLFPHEQFKELYPEVFEKAFHT